MFEVCLRNPQMRLRTVQHGQKRERIALVFNGDPTQFFSALLKILPVTNLHLDGKQCGWIGVTGLQIGDGLGKPLQINF